VVAAIRSFAVIFEAYYNLPYDKFSEQKNAHTPFSRKWESADRLFEFLRIISD